MDRVQLGTLHLDLRALGVDTEPGSEEADQAWFSLTPDFIGAGFLTDISTSDEVVALLAELLADPGIGFQAEFRVASPYIVVRCSLFPSDGRGGDWRKKPKKDRNKALRKLFAGLKSGWHGGEDWVLAKRVSWVIKAELMKRKLMT